MSLFTPVIVEKPRHFQIAPLRRGWGKQDPYVIGFDSEAYRGRPMLFQFSLPNEDVSETRLHWTNTRDALDDFVTAIEGYVMALPRDRSRVIVFAWNLRYEYSQLFRMVSPDLWDLSSFIIHLHGNAGDCTGESEDGWSVAIDVLNEKRFTFTMRFADDNAKHRRVVKVIDGMAFYTTSLNKAAGIVGVDGKDDYPERLKGNVSPRKALHDAAFLSYAKRDAWITRKVGETIVKYHVDYDIDMTVSAPMFAARVYKRRFLDDVIPLCEPDIEDAGLKSYHGGKNGCYVDRPMFYRHAYDYDLNAAYTGAMSRLPDPVASVWEETPRYEPDTDGLYHVVARVRSCTYRAFQNVRGRWHTWLEDGVLDFWITSYELDAALAEGEILEIYQCSGFAMRGERGTGSLREYCDTFSELKATAPDAPTRTLAKLCLNSLYGKFIQKVPTLFGDIIPIYDYIVNEDGTHDIRDGNLVPGGYRAGGLYHPAIASMITGMVRAQVHRLEHKYQSLMTSTDGFLSLIPPDPIDIGTHVGGLKVKEGSLSLWRERLYIFDTPDTHDPCTEPTCDKHPVFALHGFRAKVPILRSIPLEPGTYDYSGRQVITLRESKRKWNGKRYEPGTFVDLPYVLDLRVTGTRSPARPS